MSLLCTTRFDPSLEAFEWNKDPDGAPSPYFLLAHQLDRILSARWSVYHSLDYTALKNICDHAVRDANSPPPLKVIPTPVSCQALTWPSAPGTRRLSPLWDHHRLRLPGRAPAL